MRPHRFAPVVLALSLSGCLSSQDPRSVADQKAELDTASAALIGNYEVTDSRVDYRHFSGISIRKGRNGLDVSFLSPTTGDAILKGWKCRGWAASKTTYVAVMCDALAQRVAYFNVSRVSQSDETIKDGAMFGGFPPMTVPAGNYIVEFTEAGSGRTHYYALAKKEAD
jgi:hypothetical protein